ncbi:methyltransferase domain-containing protein [Actinoplanes sp. TBRC 11911]|uniref:class I SAM-dependent methyltransferase n=1 Tax=Actinoplanes sp. TBRC 11911 TaxID=2729386 RepID=UPI00145E50E3|nr:class I SAM-dependent methyltransferase [Actinoplanes sp. TBRC 11911]NMO56238.1 methyltransferase domain-containing protein [Actinoplanes sp. TBRC 11911]
MLRPEIMNYYQRGGERNRLTVSSRGRLEFLRTWDVLTRVLPAPPATVLDVGGATGVYAGPLARAGYRVCVIDPVPEYVAEASALDGVAAVVGDGRALPAADDTADAVLLFGPLYHVLDRAERIVVWREAARVVRPEGVIVAATISRFFPLFDGLTRGFFRDLRYRRLVEQTLSDGTYRNVDGEPAWFTTAYLHHPDELLSEPAEAGLMVRRRITVEGPLRIIGSRLDEILADPQETAVMLEMLRTVEDEPSLLGDSHVLSVATPLRG